MSSRRNANAGAEEIKKPYPYPDFCVWRQQYPVAPKGFRVYSY